jgi:hypothetical protein
MASVVHTFDRFLHDLEPTDVERAEIARRQKLLVERISRSLGGVRQDLLAGAFARGTAVRPFDDTDLFLVLDATAHGSLREEGPLACLEAIRGALLKEGPLSREQIERQGRAVNVTISNTGIGLSIVPAFEESPGVYAIPSRDGQGWIKTDPAALERVVTRANERAGSKLIPVIRAACHWSAGHGKPLSGLHLTALALRAMPSPPLSYPQALRQVFAKVADVGQRSCPEPGGVGPDLDAGLNQEQRSRIRLMFQDATRQADQALQYDRTWRSDEAHGVWRSLLGTAYPETGKR